jgi:hypothetical protein
MVSLDADLSSVSDVGKEQAKQFIVSFGIEYLRFYQLSSLSCDALKGTLLLQVAQFVGRRERFSQLDEWVAATKAAATGRPGSRWLALDVWSLYDMELSAVATALLGITPSEAAVERTFSAQDAVHTKKRNLLSDRSVEEEMFVKFNHRALNSGQHTPRAAGVEINADGQGSDFCEDGTAETPSVSSSSVCNCGSIVSRRV